MNDMTISFPSSYEDSRNRFTGYLPIIKQHWPSARLVSHPIGETGKLTLDWIEADPIDKPEKVIIFTIGEHGIEGYVGSAMLDLFIQEFIPTLDPKNTGLALVHAINPWGMKYHRRTNSNNIDLNRNFVQEPSNLDPNLNREYAKIESFLNPEYGLSSFRWVKLAFYAGLLRSILILGTQKLKRAVLVGQYRFPRGIYYGGKEIQPEVKLIQDLFRQKIKQYPQTCLLDMHTGYGPRYQMNIVNSVFEPRTSDDLKSLFSYPLVVKADPEEFYAICGDMIDFIYSLALETIPAKKIYGTTFEFGTLGDSFDATLGSLSAMIFENWIHWLNPQNTVLSGQIMRDFKELYYPQDQDWRNKAVGNARMAFKGILHAEGFIP